MLKVNDILSNPLLLLIIGGIISGLLIPSITTQWQNHEKELEIKINLLGRISESFASLLQAREDVEIDLEHGQISNTTSNTFHNQSKGWSISTAVIGSELYAYFPNSNISKEWKRLINMTTEFYSITKINQLQRIPHLKIMEEIISTDSSTNYLDILGLIGEDYKRYWDAKNQMEKYIINQKEKILQRILSSSIDL